MSVVRVAVPVLHGRHRFHFDKGRPWSIIEHILLVALAKNTASAGELAERGNIPRRVVIEALIRLMRAGWVEMVQHPSGVSFQATRDGLVAATLDELPNVTRRQSRNMNFVVDQITGTIYRSRELPFTHTHIVEERAKRERIVWLDRPKKEQVDEVRPLIDVLFMDDEKFISIEPSGDRPAKRWSLVTVRDGEPDGLTHRAPPALIEAVKNAAKSAPEQFVAGESTTYGVQPASFLTQGAVPGEHQVNISARDLILGGLEHHEAIKSALKRARHRVLIHSTFIAEDRFNALLPDIKAALRLGVIVDVMWGQGQTSEGARSTRQVVKRIKKNLEAEDLYGLRIHPFSTNSHCKILLADEGSMDRFSAYVGSCNWFYSRFNSFEASIRLRDPVIVADVVDQMAELSKGARGHWTEFTSNLAALATNLRSLKRPQGGRARAQIVIGSSHVDLIRKARDESQRQIFVTSHRFGVAGQPAVLAPALAAAKSRGVTATVFYGTTSGVFGGNDAAELTLEASRDGITIRPVRKPRLHAKMLAWDDDAIVITSQNWLSADPPDDMPRQEIGVFVRAPGLAKILIERFNAVRLE